MDRVESDTVIVRSTIDLGHRLGLRVVAEGVETAEVWDLPAGLDCDVGEGFYLSGPMPAEEVPRWTRDWAGHDRRATLGGRAGD
jgi:diguanylate cyclase